MERELIPINIKFYLDTGKDVSQLLARQRPSVGSKASSIDCKKLVVSALAPQISVIASSAADKVAADFGYHSFFQLLKPFGDRINHKFQIKDSQLASRTADDFSVRFTRPLQDLLTVQQASIGKTPAAKTELFNQNSLELFLTEYVQSIDTYLKAAIEKEDEPLEIALKDSTYMKFFSKLISSSMITPFETLNHPIISLIVIRANDGYEVGRNLLIEFKKTSLPEYLNIDDILPIFLILYDEKDKQEMEASSSLKEQFKKQLFVDSFITSITLQKDYNPVQLSPPLLVSIDEELQSTHIGELERPKIPASNVTALYAVIKDIIQKKLIPFMEQKIVTWDDQIITPRKSITGRLFNVSKRYFGSSKFGSHQQNTEHSSNYNSTNGYYSRSAPEFLTRKLADWSFMLRDYRYAYTIYELAKKDLLSDRAWPHLASVQEMAAISLLMGATNITSKIKNDTIDPLLDSCNYTYLSRCGLKTYALRSIVITSELFCTLRDGYTSTPGALKWLQKGIDDNLVGRIGKSLLLERLGYIYSICMSSQAKILLTKKGEVTDTKESTTDDEHYVNPLKLTKNNISTIGLTRERKSAFWYLLAAKDWDPVSQPLQVQVCLEMTAEIYKKLDFTERKSSLYVKLLKTTLKNKTAIA